MKAPSAAIRSVVAVVSLHVHSRTPAAAVGIPATAAPTSTTSITPATSAFASIASIVSSIKAPVIVVPSSATAASTAIALATLNPRPPFPHTAITTLVAVLVEFVAVRARSRVQHEFVSLHKRGDLVRELQSEELKFGRFGALNNDSRGRLIPTRVKLRASEHHLRNDCMYVLLRELEPG
eukprot:CAMPEP_0184389066 /NCGR_PEP_ID=MMETSP0007-20130409/12167_1 /TAXON_ID=97485 /ORGANISM="Prymnesium parvum, Strain Texoma1" /LENGTH=179 /DNA_ID=CAMNT_0026738217 /DNA_START=355 /DNA_END=894 /DNA_ORIENTATION=-